MSAKNRDSKNRWRNITVGFRVSPDEGGRFTGPAEAGILLPPLSQSGCGRAGQSEGV